jgi:putative PIN family toxin of toxin-antitoxin system
VKVVVDTNVLVAGLLSPFGPPGEILRMIAAGSLRLCLDARILTEYADVLSRPKFHFDADLIQILLEQIRADGQSVGGRPLPVGLPDPTDEPFLETALAGNAVCVITGNTKHFPASRRHGMSVFAPRDFLDYYRRQKPRTKR